MEGSHQGPTRQGRALDPCGQVLAPHAVSSVPDIFKYSRKNHIKFAGHLEKFYFQGIFYCKDNSENRQKNTPSIHFYKSFQTTQNRLFCTLSEMSSRSYKSEQREYYKLINEELFEKKSKRYPRFHANVD